jgi:hypothetical protein
MAPVCHSVKLAALLMVNERMFSIGNVARVIGVDGITTVTITMRVNIYMIGFDGNGAFGVNMTYDSLSSWLNHLDHSIPQYMHDTHLRGLSPLSPPSSLTSDNINDDDHSHAHAHTHTHTSARSDNDRSDIKAPKASINYRFDYHVIELSSSVTDVIHHVRKSAMRPVCYIS